MRRGGSLLVEFHGWRGFGRDRDLFWLHLRCGFVSLAIDRLVSDRLRKWGASLQVLRQRLEPRDTIPHKGKVR